MSDALEAAMQAAATGADADSAALRTALLSASLIVPIRDDDPGDPELVILEHDGHPYVPAFTSADLAAANVPSGFATATIPVQTLVDSWDPRVALALNPGEEPSRWIDGGGVVALRGAEELLVPDETAVAVGEPAEEPDELLAVARDHLAGRPEVVAAHRAQVLLGGQGEVPRLLLLLRVGGDGAAADRQAQELAAVLADHPWPVDVAAAPVRAELDPLLAAVADLPPFHTAP